MKTITQFTAALIALPIAGFAATRAVQQAPQPPAFGESVEVQGQQQPGDPAQARFTAEQLEQMVAPIALHPDTLLTQIFMAATYPLEVVEAQRWRDQYAQLEGTDLEEALKQHDWDPSVKSLCGVPDVLKQMSDNLDWTQDLGDAFLGQKEDLLDAVQRMRRKAVDAGNLKTSAQQSVSQDDRYIVVEQADPQVIYVPTYSPLVVYGPGWYYPYWYYPGFYAPPPPGYGYLSFSFGFYWGWGAWSHCDWHHHSCGVDVDRFNHFNQRTSGQPGLYHLDDHGGRPVTWHHDPEHRRGVGYRNPQLANRFGAAPGESRVSREQARGFRAGEGFDDARGTQTRGDNRDSLTPGMRDPSAPGVRARPTPTPIDPGMNAPGITRDRPSTPPPTVRSPRATPPQIPSARPPRSPGVVRPPSSPPPSSFPPPSRDRSSPPISRPPVSRPPPASRPRPSDSQSPMALRDSDFDGSEPQRGLQTLDGDSSKTPRALRSLDSDAPSSPRGSIDLPDSSRGSVLDGSTTQRSQLRRGFSRGSLMRRR